MEEKRYIKLTDPDALSAPDPNVPGLEETFAAKAAYHFKVDISEKQDELLMSKIQKIGGDVYQDITIDKSKVLDALGKYVAKRVDVGQSKDKWLQLTYYFCPTCGFEVVAIHNKFDQVYGTSEYSKPMLRRSVEHYNYCRECGQHLDWSGAFEEGCDD